MAHGPGVRDRARQGHGRTRPRRGTGRQAGDRQLHPRSRRSLAGPGDRRRQGAAGCGHHHSRGVRGTEGQGAQLI
ncbi:conserved hypothetical protein [Mycolicibacterium smegmatis MC2 155]|uniref:Uncharacterized protein n=1 Tax=Mycolicibacterium smegmatis (strain ATCC 700084 / mc(2)155) TaxID=246196 RepID=A0R5Q5_MYCS2|nr:conserved hypothetical protein [Mycolicibacterium smegmatis MC2 155]